MLRNKFGLMPAIACLLATGCTSISSTLLSRDEGNTHWQREQHLPGVPITLKVPTHVKVYVVETYYLQKVTDGGVPRTERLKLPFTIRDFAQEFVYTEKIFTVDFKRPAAGKYNLHLGMTTDQYIQTVEHDVTDETIRDVSALIDQLAGTGLLPRAASGQAGTTGPLQHLYEVKSVAAVGLFEIDAPDFEQQLTGFINCHLTQAHDAWVVPPGVEAIHRVPLAGYDQDSNLCSGPIVPQGASPFAPTATPHGGPPPGFVPQGSGVNYDPRSALPVGSPPAVGYPPGAVTPNYAPSMQAARPGAPYVPSVQAGPNLEGPSGIAPRPSLPTAGAPLPAYTPLPAGGRSQPTLAPQQQAAPVFRYPESYSR